MSILTPDEYHIGRQSESVVVGVPALALTSARPRVPSMAPAAQAHRPGRRTICGPRPGDPWRTSAQARACPGRGRPVPGDDDGHHGKPVTEPIDGRDTEDASTPHGHHAFGRFPGRGGTTLAGRAPQDRRLLAGRQLPLGRADLPARQPAPEGAAQARAHQAAAARPLGHVAGPEHALRPPQSGHQAR